MADGSYSEDEACRKKQRPKWTNDLDKDKQMLCMALAMEDNYSDVEKANIKTLRDYEKKGGRTTKAMKGI